MVFIHDIWGVTDAYRHIKKALQATSHASLEPFETQVLSIEMYAQEALRHLPMDSHPEDCTFVGWSSAGMIAYEMARLAQSSVVLLDSILHYDLEDLDPWKMMHEALSLNVPKIGAPRSSQAIVAACSEAPTPLGHIWLDLYRVPEARSQHLDLVRARYEAACSFRPRRTNARVLHVGCTVADRALQLSNVRKWRTASGELFQSTWLEASHFSLINAAHGPTVAKLVESWL